MIPYDFMVIFTLEYNAIVELAMFFLIVSICPGAVRIDLLLQ